MKELIRLQTEVATGRFTLPVVILVCLLLWTFTFGEWSEWMSFGVAAIVGYLMIEANTAFTLIRTRTSLPVCIYWFLHSILLFLHSSGWEVLVPLAFILATFHFFRSYESPAPPFPVFHTFLFISLGSLVFPPFFCLAPLYFFAMMPFRALNAKSFWASLIGCITPYWFLFGYAFCFDNMPLFLEPLQAMGHFHLFEFGQVSMSEALSWGVVTVSLIISCVHYWQVSYMDKTRTRICFSFMALTGLLASLFCILQPPYAHGWMQIQLIPTAFLMGHLFSLTRNRFSGILFIVTFVAYISLMLFNLWM